MAEPYERFWSAFRWQLPESFNFGTDVVDRWAEKCGIDAASLPAQVGELPQGLRVRARTC